MNNDVSALETRIAELKWRILTLSDGSSSERLFQERQLLIELVDAYAELADALREPTP